MVNIASNNLKQFNKFLICILIFFLNACALDTAIETKREYDEDGAMLYYLNEKKSIEPRLNSILKQCQSHKGSVQLHWHINREGKASQITLMSDSLNCQSMNNLLKEHLSTLQFQKPQPVDRVELDYIFNFTL